MTSSTDTVTGKASALDECFSSVYVHEPELSATQQYLGLTNDSICCMERISVDKSDVLNRLAELNPFKSAGLGISK